ncbi:MAG: bifunctional adenosylcobinamide kinase/adenosylcobinamide-phosphate guanylyltransferase [Bacteriovoracaceae bacterium]
MKEITLIVGGAKSGKTKLALKKLLEHQGPKFYLATCPRIDDEMDEKIKNHQTERLGHNIETIEEEIDLRAVIEKTLPGEAILIDCLTLWINNLIFHKKINNEKELEDLIIKTFSTHKSKLFIVTNEVGNGLVPIQKESRIYRDLLGKANQVLAELSDKVILVSCGLPLQLKG